MYIINVSKIHQPAPLKLTAYMLYLIHFILITTVYSHRVMCWTLSWPGAVTSWSLPGAKLTSFLSKKRMKKKKTDVMSDANVGLESHLSVSYY